MSNTRYHLIGLKVKEKQESNPGRQSDDRMGENSRGKARGVARHNFKRRQLSPPTPKNAGPGFLHPDFFLNSALLYESFSTFSENKNKLSHLLKRGSWVLPPGKCLNSE